MKAAFEICKTQVCLAENLQPNSKVLGVLS